MPNLWKHLKKFIHKYEAQIIIVAIVLLIFNPLSFALYKSTLFLLEILPGSPIKPLGIFTKEPVLQEVTYKSGDKTIFADLYSPRDGKKHPAAVLHFGLDIDRKDPRGQMIANAFARSGLIVLIPNLPTISSRRINTESPQELTDSFALLKTVPQADKDKLGIVGFCATAGVEFVSANDPKIAEDINFLVSIDPYYDFKSFMASVVSRQVDGKTWVPHFKTAEIINREAIFLLRSKTDEDILSKYLLNIPQENLSKGIYQKLSITDYYSLTVEGRNVYEGLTAKTREEFNEHFSKSTDDQKNAVAKLSPSTYISDLNTKVFILVDTDNILIPYSEGRNFKGKIKNLTYSETTLMPSGEEPKKLPLLENIKEGTNLFKFIYAVFLRLQL